MWESRLDQQPAGRVVHTRHWMPVPFSVGRGLCVCAHVWARVFSVTCFPHPIHHYGLSHDSVSTFHVLFSNGVPHRLNGCLLLSPIAGYLWFPYHNDHLCFWARSVPGPFSGHCGPLWTLSKPHTFSGLCPGATGRGGTGGWKTRQSLPRNSAVRGDGKTG